MARNEQARVTVRGRFVGGGLFEPRSSEEGKPPRYSACVVLDDGEEKKINKIVKAAIDEKWGNKPPKGMVVWGAREGDDPEFEASYESYFINPKSTRPPQTLVKNDGLAREVAQEDDIIYPGCYVAVSVNAYAYDGDKAKGIKPGATVALRAVMFVKDGERLGDYVDVENEFGGVESEFDDDEDDGDDFLATG